METKDYAVYANNLQSFSTTDGRIAFLDEGEGEPLVLLHGVPTSSWLYRKMIDPLVDAGYRVIVPDMLGFGMSDKPKDPSLYDPEDHAKRMLELMNHLQIDSWVQVVHDAGGPWTWPLILKNQSKINKLILLNTILFEEGFNPPMRLKRGSFMAKLVTSFYGTKIGAGIIVRSTLKAGTKRAKLTKGEKKGYCDPVHEEGNIAIGRFFTGFPTMFEDLPGIQAIIKSQAIPVFAIWGAKDKILQQSQTTLMMNKLNVPEENIFVIEDADHFLQEDVPNVVAEKIIDFLKK